MRLPPVQRRTPSCARAHRASQLWTSVQGVQFTPRAAAFGSVTVPEGYVIMQTKRNSSEGTMTEASRLARLRAAMDRENLEAVALVPGATFYFLTSVSF